MIIHPFILGSGRAAQAIQKSLLILESIQTEFKFSSIYQLKRGESFSNLVKPDSIHLLCIANPPGLHTQAILQGEENHFDLILVEKPACVSIEDAHTLRKIKTPVAVCHVYRQTWGVQTLKQMLDAGEFGEIIAIEGRYWQSSAAQRAIGETAKGGWKNDPKLCGSYDALLDVGTHWVDAALFLIGEKPVETSCWLSYANAEAPHRDTHVQLSMTCQSGVRIQSSISKTIHGATNHFELNVLGTKGTATWTFLNPDQIILGHGSSLKTLCRKQTKIGSHQPPFHGLGWLEGYVEILHQFFLSHKNNTKPMYPTLSEHLDVLKALLLSKQKR